VQKQALVRTVKLFSITFILLIAWVFIRSAGPDWSSQNPEVSLNVAKLTQGDVVLMEAAGNAYYVIYPTNDMLENLEQQQHYSQSKRLHKAYNLNDQQQYFVISAFGEGGCMLRSFKHNEANPRADVPQNWLGGLVDLCDKVSYDYSGRLITTSQYTYHESNNPRISDDLTPAKITYGSKNKLYIE
jgi:hypothetical protein